MFHNKFMVSALIFQPCLDIISNDCKFFVNIRTLDRKKIKMDSLKTFRLGIDIGSTTVKVAVIDDDDTGVIMGCFENKFVGEFVEVDVIEVFPDAVTRDDIFVADAFGDELFGLVFVCHDVVERIVIVEFKPLKFFVECFGMIQIDGISHADEP